MELKTKYKPFKEEHKKSCDFTCTFERNQWVFKFDNGYGASVVCHKMGSIVATYGTEENPFELGVLCNFTEDGYELCYDTPITDDVIGYLTEKEVEEYLEKIEKL